MAFFVAFYSYKGGVGRTMALANVAYSLAERGKRVVLLDMDLEAPGLQDYPEFSLKGTASRKGFLEYAAVFRRSGRCPSIKGYIHPCAKSPGSGKLWLMPAGSIGSAYQQQLGNISWRRLHPKRGTESFIAELRTTLIEEFRPDYVLIDSRTGLSDIGGLSTHHLADMVVLVFNLTLSCIEGSVRAHRSFLSPESRVRYIQLVASPVPPLVSGAESLVEQRLQQASELMALGTAYGRAVIRVDYNPAMVLVEELAVRQPDKFPAAASYEAVREAIQRANPEEVFAVLERAQELRAKVRFGEALQELQSFVREHPNNSEGNLELGNLLMEGGRLEEASQAFRKASTLAPDLALFHRRLGESLVALERSEEAIVALTRAIELGDRSHEVHRALLKAHEQQGDTEQESEARRNAMLSLLSQNEPTGIPGQSTSDLRRDFIDILSHRPPFAAFRPEPFWDDVMGSLSISTKEKFLIVRHLLAGKLNPSQISDLQKILGEERSRWEKALGPAAGDFQGRVAQELADPQNPESLLRLRRGDQADAPLLLFVVATGKLPANRKVALLEEASERDPGNTAARRHLASALLQASKDQKEKASVRNILQRAVESMSIAATDEIEGHLSLADLGVALNRLAELSTGEERKQLLNEACQKYQEAVRRKPDMHYALYNWGSALGILADLAQGEERKQLLSEACQKYQDAVRHKPDMQEAFDNWGIALWALADLAQGEERKQLLNEACQKYQEAVRHKPDMHGALYNWGIALRRLADLAQGEERKQLLNEACQKYQEAVRHKPDMHETLNNWGSALWLLADLAQGEERKQLLNEACQKYQEAVRHKPDMQEALNNWGSVLWALADLAQGEERKQLLNEACQKYQEAVRHKPDMHETLNNWANVTCLLAYVAEGEEGRSLWCQAAELARKANAIEPGAGDYNLACALSQLGSFDEAADMLTRYLQSRPHLRAHALDDTDLVPLWENRPDLRRQIEEQLLKETSTPSTSG